ncbi:hypothetical protein B0J18DRAFT_44211 [Chaetomium sp. MPI-SDFR-AT-0129]|nr:hypothetical protein B0J18DRAFT_44211 [Chaetomium sp. MPI-SDFR-AT-0129]
MLGPFQRFPSVARWSCRPVKSLVPCMGKKNSVVSNRDSEGSSSSEPREVLLVNHRGVSFPRERAASVQPGLSCMCLFSACLAGLSVGKDAARDFKTGTDTPSLCLKTSPAGARVLELELYGSTILTRHGRMEAKTEQTAQPSLAQPTVEEARMMRLGDGFNLAGGGGGLLVLSFL